VNSTNASGATPAVVGGAVGGSLGATLFLAIGWAVWRARRKPNPAPSTGGGEAELTPPATPTHQNEYGVVPAPAIYDDPSAVRESHYDSPQSTLA
jgi:hypothetical protein